MARYEHLPIYKAAFDLTVYVENIVRHFSRYHKYTLGADLRNQARGLVGLIVRANTLYDRDKLPVLYELRDALEQMKLTIRVSKEVKAFHNARSFQVVINQVVDISKQNEGWIRHLTRKDTFSEPDDRSAQESGQGQHPGGAGA